MPSLRDETAIEWDDTGPIRMCALTRERRSDAELMRFALGPDNRVTPDLRRNLPGRGVWLSPTRRTVEDALRRNIFAKGFKASVAADGGLPDLIDGLLRRAALQALALANKAGDATFGFAKVEQLVASGEAAALIHAADAGDDGRRRLDRKFVAIAATAGRDAFIDASFSGEELSAALGRENAVHAALKYSGATIKFIREVRRWLVYNGLNPSETGGAAFVFEKATR
ncbi:MAG: RNA-binding protein [Hyphomicrobiales bacterium]|nr:RNA-binding protein [Hyphomicrobiales bacterium]